MRFKEAAFGLSVNELSLITERHPQTIRRYLRTNKAPCLIVKLVSLYRAGRLPSLHESWNGWRVNGPLLIDPDGNSYRAEEIRGVWAVRQLRRELERIRGKPAQYILDL